MKQSATFCWLAYRLLSVPLLLLWAGHAIHHGIKNQLPNYIGLRTFANKPGSGGSQIWVHAASLGEVNAVSPLVERLLERGESVLLTSFTATGFQAIERNFNDRVECAVIPFEFFWLCRRFFRQRKIKLGLIVETELWPELLHQAKHEGIPLLSINARMTEKTYDSNIFIRQLLLRTLNYFSHFYTRNEADRTNLRKLGIDDQKISIIGNLKETQQHSQPERLISGEYLLLASSHSNEEELFLKTVVGKLAQRLLVIAPRHPNRSETIAQLIEASGLRYCVRSKSQPIEADTQVYLADTLGELTRLMAHAKIVIMGGSFVDIGGHNLIEPANLGCTIITGPFDSNIKDDIRLLENGKGIIQVNSVDEAWRWTEELLADPVKASSLGEQAKRQLDSRPDIVVNYVEAIAPWLQA